VTSPVAERQAEVALAGAVVDAVAPVWEAVASALLWVDARGKSVHRFRPGDGTDEVVPVPQQVGAARPRTNGGLALNLRDGIGLREPDGTLRWLVYWHRDGAHGHDAAVDPAGRLWAGSGDWLVRVEPDGRTTTVPSVARAGRMDWTPDGSRVYQIDQVRGRIDVLDYDLTTGEATDRRPLCADLGGTPTALCVDAEHGVWVAAGATVRRYATDGALELLVDLPMPATGCCFGGDTLTDLYLTTSNGPLLVIPDLAPGQPSTRFTG